MHPHDSQDFPGDTAASERNIFPNNYISDVKGFSQSDDRNWTVDRSKVTHLSGKGERDHPHRAYGPAQNWTSVPRAHSSQPMKPWKWDQTKSTLMMFKEWPWGYKRGRETRRNQHRETSTEKPAHSCRSSFQTWTLQGQQAKELQQFLHNDKPILHKLIFYLKMQMANWHKGWLSVSLNIIMF